MLCIDMGVVGKWAERKRLVHDLHRPLREARGLRPHAAGGRRGERDSPGAARIHKFVLLYKELDADDEELTRTRKVRRAFVEERYRDVVAALYGDVPRSGSTRRSGSRTERPRTSARRSSSGSSISGGLRAEFFLQLVLNGIVIGSIYALVGLGFVIIYKSSSILNFAQGEFLMLGAYVCLAVFTTARVPFVAAFALTLLFSVMLGVLLERVLLRPMIGEPVISVIMLTLGLSSVLKAVRRASGAPTRARTPISSFRPDPDRPAPGGRRATSTASRACSSCSSSSRSSSSTRGAGSPCARRRSPSRSLSPWASR